MHNGEKNKRDLDEGVDNYENLLQLELKHNLKENCTYKFDRREPRYKKANICNNKKDKGNRLFGARIDIQ